jgi:hypothetical protein
MNKQLSYLLQHRVKRKKGDTTKLAAQLAPLEEQKERNAPQHVDSGHAAIQGGATQEYGAIVVDNESVRLSNDIMEGKGGSRFLGMEPVVLAILAFMLAFIAFIAWQISRMPPQ